MKYIIRCIWPRGGIDCIKTARGYETIYGPPKEPTIFTDLNQAYQRINFHHGAECQYEVEEYQ